MEIYIKDESFVLGCVGDVRGEDWKERSAWPHRGKEDGKRVSEC